MIGKSRAAAKIADTVLFKPLQNPNENLSGGQCVTTSAMAMDDGN